MAFDLREQLKPVHFGHSQIGDEQIALFLAQALQALDRINKAGDFGAKTSERGPKRLEHLQLVIDDKNMLSNTIRHICYTVLSLIPKMSADTVI
jgi:hypothetical protein